MPRPYHGSDRDALLACWNRALPLDPIDAATFTRRVLLDPNFDPERLLVTESQGVITGFCLGLVRRVELEGTGLEPDRGWITAMGVLPECRRQGLGAALLEGSLNLFDASGHLNVTVAAYIPGYFVPGVDEHAYADGIAFLRRRGFHVVQRPIAMDANLVHLATAPEPPEGVDVRPLDPLEIPELLAFLRAHMPGDWLRHARELLLADLNAGRFTIAVRSGEIVGYCQFDGEHFGPFGVRDDCQSLGIGKALLGECLQAMRRAGHHNAWVLWTSDEAAQKVYARFGFRETRRFAVMRRP